MKLPKVNARIIKSLVPSAYVSTNYIYPINVPNKKSKVEKRLKNYGSVAVSGTLRIMSVNVYCAQHTRHVCLDGFVLWLASGRLQLGEVKEAGCQGGSLPLASSSAASLPCFA